MVHTLSPESSQDRDRSAIEQGMVGPPLIALSIALSLSKGTLSQLLCASLNHSHASLWSNDDRQMAKACEESLQHKVALEETQAKLQAGRARWPTLTLSPNRHPHPKP